jgi:leukotriene-A4 hydrolase
MRLDPHSYADTEQPRTVRLDLDLRVDFARQQLRGMAELAFAEPSGGPLDLDTRDLAIEQVIDLSGRPLPFTLHSPDAALPALGSRLRILLPPATSAVRVRYATSPGASALQWLTPAQTAGGKHPYLYSQCQAIHARSLAPLQDSPRFRIRYGASLAVPEGLRALMAAAPLGRVRAGPGEVKDRFEMPQPIPPYLLALAVGDLATRPLSQRCAVWAEPSVVDAAAAEFAEVESMIAAAEALFGPYDWDRFDLLVMPPSFPYGGMENPRLTFLTPSLLAGDRSLVTVVAHELAHAWTGNLVTNASADDFWLNEGFTVYAERRILEALHGRAIAELHACIGRHELEVALARFAARPQLTRLRNDLRGIDPDDAFSSVPYEKGYLLLRHLEETAGRPAFDKFLKSYLQKFRFQSVTTQELLDALEAELPGLAARAGAAQFLDEPGLPDFAPRAHSQRLEEVQALALDAAAGKAAMPEVRLGQLTPAELLLFLQALPADLTAQACGALRALLRPEQFRSLELRVAWLSAALRAGDPLAPDEAAHVLVQTGRMKYLRPLYTELWARPETRELAQRVFARAQHGYHPIARQSVERILGAAR